MDTRVHNRVLIDVIMYLNLFLYTLDLTNLNITRLKVESLEMRNRPYKSRTLTMGHAIFDEHRDGDLDL